MIDLEDNEKEENEINENKIIDIPNDNLELKKLDDKDKDFVIQLLISYYTLDIKKTKIRKKDDFISLINIISKLENEEFILFTNYLDMKEISIYKLIINGFIDFDIQDKAQEKKIIQIISKIIYILYSKSIFYFIYKKLSKFFRLHTKKICDLIAIRKFEKIFNIWKILYDTKILFENYHYISAISFFPNNNEQKYFVIHFKEKLKINDNEEATDQIEITINFLPYFLLDINKINKNFSFLNVYNKDGKVFNISYNMIFKDNNNIKSFSDIQNIKFKFLYRGYTISINNDKFTFNEKVDFDFNYIQKIEILDNFFGKILCFSLKKYMTFIPKNPNNIEVLKRNFNLEIKLKDSHIDINATFNGIKIENEINEYIDYEGEIFSNKLVNKNSKFDLSNIQYFGGLNSFIPIFKIIKYIIIKLGNIDKNNKENKINEQDYIKESIIWIKDILKIIIKLICMSEKNYNNFLDIAVPLIGCLAEIYHTLNELLSSKIISNDIISFLFNDEIFFILYIIILNSQLPKNIKKIFNNLFKINNNLANFNFTMKPLILELNEIKDLDWYFLFLFIFIEFNILYLDSPKNIFKELIEHLENIKEYKEKILKEDISLIITFIIFLKEYCFEEKDEKCANDLFESFPQLKKGKLYLKYTLHLIKTFLNIQIASTIIGFNYNKKNFPNIQQTIILSINSNFIGGRNTALFNEENLNEIIKYLKDFIDYFNFLQQLFPKISINNFIPKNKLIMNEFIDIHGQYRHLIKELFIFNRLWSNQKLFFKNTLKEIKDAKLKYKIINYYTKNFERPILYPYLDYKYHYPDFSLFKIEDNKTFYNVDELEDDYNFEIDCPELDTLILENDNKLLKEIKKIGTINMFKNTCLVKQAYHIKGNLFLVKDINNMVTIYFYSYPYNFQNNAEKKPTCNKISKEKNILCYGSIFKCPIKERNRKIKIELTDIRLMMKKIYFYRNSSIEIFTETKSYYFNFISENDRDDFFSLFILPFENLYFPININGGEGEIIGFKKINKEIMKSLNYLKLLNEKNNFIKYITKEMANSDLCQMCVFDILILINLISNRSYIDLHQYPVFPLINFFDKKEKKVLKRDIKKHIGFQTLTKGSESRYNAFFNSYKGNEMEYKEAIDNGEQIEIPHYFNTHYSNIVYTCNYLMRIFPYSFIAIELQGNGFDSPNRLFNSIEDTFNNILHQKSDLRELIPEFFYLPEMLMNINTINFHINSNDQLVDDVVITENCFANEKIKEQNIDNNYQKFFIFIENMKNDLESLKEDINDWINIIFGIYQKKIKKLGQTFREESYIDIDENTRKKYLNDDLILKSVEFGIIPLQTIFSKKIYTFPKFQKIKKSSYKKNIESSNEKANKNGENSQKFDMKTNNVKKEFNQYWEEPLNLEFKISEEDKIFKLKLYRDNILVDELIDHNDKIIDCFYNYRLNMFATISYDGFICIYILPNKLISMIKCPNNSYYDHIFLSANPFPSVIAFDEKYKKLVSYSISGLIIKEIILNSINNSIISIEFNYNIYGGTFNDTLIIKFENKKKGKKDKKEMIKIYSVPFFEIIKDY